MNLILNTIKENFGTEKEFTDWDIHKITNVDLKVVRENLSIMINMEQLCYVVHHELGLYKLRTDEEKLLFLRHRIDLENHT